MSIFAIVAILLGSAVGWIKRDTESKFDPKVFIAPLLILGIAGWLAPLGPNQAFYLAVAGSLLLAGLSSLGLPNSSLLAVGLGTSLLVGNDLPAQASLVVATGSVGVVSGLGLAVIGPLVGLLAQIGLRPITQSVSATAFDLIFLILAALAAVASFVPAKFKTASAIGAGLLGAVTIAFVLKTGTKFSLTDWAIVGGVAASGFGLLFLGEDKSGGQLTNMLGATLAIGVSTLSYSFAGVSGAVVGLLVAAVVAAVADDRRLVFALLPLLGLTAFRVLAKLPTVGSEYTLDLAKNYAFLGLVLGLVVPTLIVNFSRASASSQLGRWVAILLVVAVTLLPGAAQTILGNKAIVAWVAGVGFSALTFAGASWRSLVGASGSLLAAALLPSTKLDALLQGTRDHKLVVWAVIGVVLAAVVVFGLRLNSEAEVEAGAAHA